MAVGTTKIPEAALSQHIAVLGKTGSGKSSVIRLLVESMLEAQKPVCIIDPKGDWWGIKSSADGKRAGYPVVIFGGEHADVPLNVHAGAQVAELIATGNRPCLIDLGGWMVGERTRFFIDFASTLFKHTRGLRWLVVDEVHNFAPQGKVLDPDAGKMLHWANRIASEGRGKGVQIIAASQRPQKVHKDFLTSCETLIAMRVVHPLDRGAIKDWIDGCPDPAKGREVLASLASMPRGEGWVWSPEIGFGPQRVAFPMFRTYDSFRPHAGQSTTKLAGWAAVDLDDVKARLATVVREAEENDPKRLRAEIARLKRAGTPAAPAAEAALAERYLAGVKYGHDTCKQKMDKELTLVKQLITKASDILADLTIAHGVISRAYDLTPAARTESAPARPSAPAQRVTPLPRQPGGQTAPAGGITRMLTALAQRPQGMNRKQLGVRAGLASKGGTFGTYLGRMRSEGWINGDASIIRITQAGLTALGSYTPLPVGAELRAHWLDVLGNSGAARLLQVLSEAYPDSLPKAVAAERANLASNAGTFGTYLGRLRALELVTGSGELRAADELFD